MVRVSRHRTYGGCNVLQRSGLTCHFILVGPGLCNGTDWGGASWVVILDRAFERDLVRIHCRIDVSGVNCKWLVGICRLESLIPHIVRCGDSCRLCRPLCTAPCRGVRETLGENRLGAPAKSDTARCYDWHLVLKETNSGYIHLCVCIVAVVIHEQIELSRHLPSVANPCAGRVIDLAQEAVRV